MKTIDSQTSRLRAEFAANPGVELSSVHLNRVGSGKELGWLQSFSRRISDLRKLGMDIRCRKERHPDKTLHTFYTYHPEGI